MKIMKVVFKDNIKSYSLVFLLSVLAGLFVVICLMLPNNNLWSFSYWSSSTYGFWMFTTSLIVLLSEKRKTAIINTSMYVFMIFLITTIYQSIKMYFNLYTPFDSLMEIPINSITGWLLYSIIPAVICGVLGAILYSGRKDKILCVMPAIFILIETIILFISVFTKQMKLFSAITDLISLILYIIFLIRCVFNKNVKTEDI